MATKAMLKSSLLVTFLLGLPSLSSAAPQKRSVVHERRDLAQRSPWSKRERIPQDEVFEMRIGLAQQNTHRGHDLLMEVSDPRSPKYGQHWSPEEVTRAFGPSDETIQAAVSWVSSALGIEDAGERLRLGAGGGWLRFEASVREAEALLDTEYWFYEHEETAQQEGEGWLAAGVEHYSVPEEMAEHVDFVFPGVVLGELNKPGPGSGLAKRATQEEEKKKKKKTRRQTSAANSTTCAELLTPSCIKELYGLPEADKAHANNSLGLFEQSSWYQYEDLDLFFATYAPEIPQGTRPRNLSIDQAAWFYDNPGNETVTYPDEADLDIEIAWPLIYPQNITVFQVDDVYYNLYSASTLGLFNTFLDALDGAYCNYSAYGETGDNAQYDPIYPNNKLAVSPGIGSFDPGTYKLPTMCGVYEPTNVISISYSREETTFTQAYQKRQCDEFLKLGLMGVSIIVSSGDSGPLASASCHASSLGSFTVSSPSNCPYVTSVGATQLLAAADAADGSNTTEAAAKGDDGGWASGGGFSAFYAAPDYQQAAVAAYFADHDLPAGVSAGAFNASGRGVPDLSAVGLGIGIAVGGALTLGEGTSAATPLFAAMLNLVNEERLAAGKGTVGFVNPVLYANASRIFRDVTQGNNDMCSGAVAGFEAVSGWDPVTGLGTPQWEGLKEVFLGLP